MKKLNYAALVAALIAACANVKDLKASSPGDDGSFSSGCPGSNDSPYSTVPTATDVTATRASAPAMPAVLPTEETVLSALAAVLPPPSNARRHTSYSRIKI